jgi:hypothetical protein
MDGPIVRDSAGITIVDNPAQDSEVIWQISSDPDVDIGGGVDDLFRVVSPIRLSDGRIVVGNGGTSEIRYYAPDGRLIKPAGRDGEGPGEFRRIAWLGRRGADSIVVYDLDLLRLSILDSAGTFVRSFQLETTDSVTFAYVIGSYADGSFLTNGFGDTGGETPDGLQRYRSPLHWFGPDGALLQNLGFFSGSEMYYMPFGNGGFSVVEAVFGRQTTRIAGPDHLYIAANDTYQIDRYTSSGGLTASIRRAHEAVAVSNVHIDAEKEGRLAAASGRGAERIRETFDDIPIPETFPAYHVIRVDEAGNLWVQDYAIPPQTSGRWTVFDPEGIMQATVELPVGLDPTHIGNDFVLGTWKDDVDVEHVRLYGLDRST